MYVELLALESVFRDQIDSYEFWCRTEGAFEEKWAELRGAIETLLQAKKEADLGKVVWVYSQNERNVRPMRLEIISETGPINRFVSDEELKHKRGRLYFSEEKV
jgi:hypothetical protein